ncbi:Rne/Rng family ribonuclease [Micromonospora sp. 4G57]|uniref:Rne/Rng family ribonuclease n=1 Tax=Micromonospora sicca TaxID=2202420 RepID=A0ABU5JNW2_9ACTN|nr:MULTISPECIES: Rne/Rng family ribonuclease [unclassified Micromonospora]MDZ5443746.1 Rne/Rng family ribonuclease [Micromonospora sp. 4G57]MDZ5494322.1 Rne/Rng family ribonuclease [Micromonospora sp. 4G53]
MLENEPEGGERTGSQPAGDTADTSTDSTAEVRPPARKRTSRRKAAPLNQPEQTEAPAEAPADAGTTTGESPQAEVFAPVAGELEAAPKTPRRRRKATTAKAVEEPVVATAAEEDSAEAVPPVKVTRTRRRKAVPPAAEAAPAEPEAAAEEEAAEPAEAEEETSVAENAAEATPTESGTAEIPPAAEAATAPPTGAEDRTGDVAPGAAVPGEQPAEQPEPRTRRRRAALSAPTVLFMAPQPEEAPVVRATAPAPAAEEPAEEPVEEPVETGRRRRRARREVEPVEVEVEVDEEPAVEAEEIGEAEDEDEESAAARRRRRRGRRGRGRGKGGAEDIEDEEAEEAIQAESAEAEAEEAEEEEGEGDGMTRRRRRRRRRGAGEVETAAEDGVPTVVKIREPRRAVDEVQGVSGSTRLEAKRQRRRDGREQRRTRPPILSESEFLARREAVDRVMAVRQRGDRTQIAVLEDGVLVEHYVTRNSSGTMAGNVYLGKVQNVLPSMEAAFVDIGRGRNAVLYAGEVNWDTSGLEGRARSIEQALRSGDSVLVQVTKDPIGHKGARLTSHIALSGRHLVYVPHGNASGISRKLPDTERKRLRDVLKRLVPDGAGVIVRTAAEGASEDELARDVKRLQAQWEDIQAKAAEGGAPVLLYEEPDLVIRVVRDLFNEDFRELVIEGEQAYDVVESYLSHVSPDLVARLRRHAGTTDVFAEYRIDEQILKGLDRKVFLPSGGSLVIDRTEAMTVIDVNTGKYTGSGGNLEETVTRNNLEAAEEIVRQLRLRDLGGIVVIDFIDMVLESNRELVLRRLTECLGRDRTKHQVTEITSLGLVQMTRKRIGAGLLEAFSETCECCKGRGLIIHTEPVPEKPRSGGVGEKVKAVASAVTTPAAEQGTASSRRRARKSAAPEKTVAEVTETTDAADAGPPTEPDYHDTMGYDLSRYESETAAAPAVADSQEGESARLAAADDPDALSDGDTDEEGTEGGTGRRRSRRGGTRRRTRP